MGFTPLDSCFAAAGTGEHNGVHLLEEAMKRAFEKVPITSL